jgi:hypothetical protein
MYDVRIAQHSSRFVFLTLYLIHYFDNQLSIRAVVRMLNFFCQNQLFPRDLPTFAFQVLNNELY